MMFDWTDWDGELDCMVFYNPTLKVPIGKHEAGMMFDCAIIMFDKGILQLIKNGPFIDGVAKPIYTANYKLTLSVGEVINE